MKQQKPWGSMSGVRPVKQIIRMYEEGLSDIEIAKSIKEEYDVSDKKLGIMFEVAKNELPIIKSFKKNSVGLYIDIPFCPSRCIYCSFASMSAEKMGRYIDPYLETLYSEIDTARNIIDDLSLSIDCVYFGGGTPTTLLPEQLNGLFKKLYESFDLSAAREITVEAGRPDTITESKLEVLKKHGTERISVNPQTMNQGTLELIGRRHTVDDTLKAFELVRSFGFSCINMDIIAGLPGESFNNFKHTVDVVSCLKPENITVHTMSIKRAADINIYGCNSDTASDETVAEMIDYSYNIMRSGGYIPYYLYRQKNILGGMENTGFCKPGFEGIYNIMMMEEQRTVVSLGVGGVTKLVKPGLIERIFNFKDVIEYINRIDEIKERKKYMYKFFNV